MIYSNSRYADGFIHKAIDSRSGDAQITVTRIFPSNSSNFYMYIWNESDRLDVIAQKTYGSSSYWSTILDYNPEIADAHNIAPGTLVRLPSV